MCRVVALRPPVSVTRNTAISGSSFPRKREPRGNSFGARPWTPAFAGATITYRETVFHFESNAHSSALIFASTLARSAASGDFRRMGPVLAPRPPVAVTRDAAFLVPSPPRKRGSRATAATCGSGFPLARERRVRFIVALARADASAVSARFTAAPRSSPAPRHSRHRGRLFPRGCRVGCGAWCRRRCSDS
jgi:hypothetical protein